MALSIYPCCRVMFFVVIRPEYCVGSVQEVSPHAPVAEVGKGPQVVAGAGP